MSSAETSADTVPVEAGVHAESIPPSALRRDDVEGLFALQEPPPKTFHPPSGVRPVRLPFDSYPTDMSSEIPSMVLGLTPSPPPKALDVVDMVIAVSFGVILFAAGIVACALMVR